MSISPYVFPGLSDVVTKKPYEFDEVISCVAEVFKVSAQDIVGKWRRRSVVEARHIAVYILRIDCDMRVIEVGSLFGRDHTTVTYAVNVVNNLMKTLPGYKTKYYQTISLLNSRQVKKHFKLAS